MNKLSLLTVPATSWDIISFILITVMFDEVVILKEKLYFGHYSVFELNK